MPGESTDIRVELATLKQELENVNSIQGRLDTAIDKLTDVSTSIKSMLAVHEEKITQQEEILIRSDAEFSANVKELHSRITTNTKELMALMSEQHKEQTEAMLKLKSELQNRVGVLEKWRWLIIGGSIFVGFILQKMIIMS